MVELSRDSPTRNAALRLTRAHGVGRWSSYPTTLLQIRTCDFLTEHSISTFKGLRNRAPGSCLVNLELLDNPGLLYHLVLLYLPPGSQQISRPAGKEEGKIGIAWDVTQSTIDGVFVEN